MPLLVLAKNLVVEGVLAPNAKSAVIGTIPAIYKPGNGYKITKIGNKRIRSVGAMIKFMSASQSVMARHVFILIILIIAFATTMRVISFFLR